MKTIALALTLSLAAGLMVASPATAGNCTYSWETAKDGSRCGKRAASERPGGY